MTRDQEAMALAELDRRVAAATASLRGQLDQLVAAPADAGDVADADAPDEPALVRLDQGDPGGRRAAGTGRRRRIVMAVAAAVVVVVVGVAAGLAAARSEPASVTSEGELQFLLPGWLPDGVLPFQALRLEDVPEAGGIGGEVVVYGIRDASDPWAGPILIVSQLVPDPATLGDETEGEAITIDGQPATVAQDEDGEWTATWSVEHGRLQVAGRGLTRDQVIAAAAVTSAGPSIDAAGLPDGFTELAHGPLDAMIAGALGYSGSAPGLAVSYAPAADRSAGTGYLTIVERAGSASAVDLARLAFDDARSVTVRGQHAVLAATGDEVLLQWAEPGGLLVTVQASGWAHEDLLRVAEGLRPAGPDEIDELVAEHPLDREDGSGASEAEVSADHVTDGWVVEGQYEGHDWLLQAFVADSQVKALWLHGGNDTAPLPMEDDTAGSGLAVTSGLFDGGVVSVFGLVDPAAASVTIEGPGLAPIAAEVHPVDGAERSAFVGFVLESDLGDSASVVARAADGTEVARAPVASPLECVDYPDGRSECTAAGSARG